MAPTQVTFKTIKITNDNKYPKVVLNLIKKNKPRPPRKKFLAVDVWQTKFSSISVRAVKDVYSTKFRVESYNMKKYSFSKCINALRKLEDPEYIAPQDSEIN